MSDQQQKKDEVSKSDTNALLCVVSPHEKGFWQADVYIDGFAEGVPPDWFTTGKKGDDQYEVMTMASRAYPGIKFTAGITGICVECGEEHFELEEECINCGGIVGDT